MGSIYILKHLKFFLVVISFLIFHNLDVSFSNATPDDEEDDRVLGHALLIAREIVALDEVERMLVDPSVLEKAYQRRAAILKGRHRFTDRGQSLLNTQYQAVGAYYKDNTRIYGAMEVLRKAITVSPSPYHSDWYASVLLRNIGFSATERARVREEAHVILLSVLEDHPMRDSTLYILFEGFLGEEDEFAVDALTNYCVVRKTRVDAHNNEDPDGDEDPRMTEVYGELEDQDEAFWEEFEFFAGRWEDVKQKEDRKYRRGIWERKMFVDSLIIEASRFAPHVVRRVLRDVFAEDPSGLEAVLKELFESEGAAASDSGASSLTSPYHPS